MLVSAGVAVTQTTTPALASLNAQSGTKNKPTSQVLQTSTTSNNMTKHGRSGGIPPGLLKAWAHSNMSVVARAITHAIFLNGTHGVELAWIAINASSNGQVIRNVAFNETVAQIQFDHDGNVELTLNSSAKPSNVFADDTELREAQSTVGLTPASDACLYDQNTHALVVFADPSSITLLYAQKVNPVPEFPTALIILTVETVFSLVALEASRRTQRTRTPWSTSGGSSAVEADSDPTST